VSYNDDGIVVLGRSLDIIDGVLCTPHRVDIIFSKPIAAESLLSMFPKFAILVVDGVLFGVKCDLFSEYENAQDQTFNRGFLVIQSSRIDGSIATITGIPTIFDAIFEHQTMQYHQMNSTGDGTRRLATFTTPIEIKMPPSPADNPILPFQIVITGKFHTNTDIVKDFQVQSQIVRDGWGWELKADYIGEVFFSSKMKYSSSIKFSSSFQCPKETWCPETNWDIIPSIPIPYLSIPFPSAIFTLLSLKSTSSRVGLVIALPLALQAKAEISKSINFNVSSNTFD
jgi:hypothetical protein